MIKKNPEAFGNALVLSGLPATQGLYGFVAFILYSGEVKTGIGMFHAAPKRPTDVT
jgi:V/A-type H+-transporting ATPase subunit K